MNRVTIKCEKVSTKRTRRWIDQNGKKRQETREFFQTISPFNRNENGETKRREEILEEINREADAWFTAYGRDA